MTQPTREPVISVRNLTAGYEGNIVLQNVSFDVYPGEIFVILGGSGCGKSTLLKHLVGLVPPISGEIFVCGHNIATVSGPERDQLLRTIGVLFQSGALFGSLNMFQNIALPLIEHADMPAPVREALIEMKLSMVGLEEHAWHLPGEISGGQKKRAGLARALALDPMVLFFDEPSAGLDPLSSALLDRLIISLNKSLGLTMVVVTHELASIFAVAHRAIMLDREAQGIIAEGLPATLQHTSEHDIVRRFLSRDPL